MKKFYTLFLIVTLIFSWNNASAQCSIQSTASSQSPSLTGGSSYTKFAVAYNPINNVYYTVNGNYLQTHSASTGGLLNSYYFVNLRGLWWNPNTSTLEAHRNGVSGLYTFTLNTNGYPTSGSWIALGGFIPSTTNVVATYDYDSDQIIYYSSGTIYKYNRSTGALVTSVSTSAIPSTVNTNTNSIVYTGCPGKELAIYDVTYRRLVFINKSTGVYQGLSSLPLSAPNYSYYYVGYANDKFFVSNGSSWLAYKVLSFGIQTNNIPGPFCDSSNVSVTFSINNLTFNSGNVFTAQLSDGSGSFSSPTTIGTVTSTTATPISAMIPANTPAGLNYRIRVIASSPATVGTYSGSPIAINIANNFLGSNANICPGDSTTLSAPDHSSFNYNWSNGATTSSIVTTTGGTYSVTVSNGICSQADTIVLTALTSPSPTLPDTTTLCGTSATLNPGTFSAYAWSNNATSSTITVSNTGLYQVTVTGSNTCTATDQTFLNLLKPTINTGDTTICAGESLDLQTESSCYFTLSSMTNQNSNNVSSPVDDNGGMAIDQDYLYYVGSGYTVRFNLALSSYTLLQERQGIFSDLSTGDLYTFWNSNYTDFYDSYTLKSNINQLKGLTQNMGFDGTTINLSQAINAGSYPTVFTGNGFVVLWSDYDNHFYKIELPSGNVTDIGVFDIGAATYYADGWAQYGIAECSGDNHSFLFRTVTHSTYGTDYFNIFRFDLSDNSFTNVTNFPTTGSNLGRMACITYSPWNNRWYFQSEYSYMFGSNNENIGYADATHNGNGGNNSSVNFAWSNSATTPVITVSPTTTTNYAVTVSSGTVSCSDTVTVTVNPLPALSLSDTTSSCNTSSTSLTTGSSFSSYEWSNGATTQTTTANTLGYYFVTVTNSNGCEASDSTFVNLLDARIGQGDTTLCSSDSVLLEVPYVSTGINITTLTDQNVTSVNTYGYLYDDRGGIAISPNYVYVNGDSYLGRYSHDLTNITTFSVMDGIFSDVNTGELYTFYSGTYFNNSSVTSIVKLDESLNSVQTIPLSTTLNFGYGCLVGAGSGFVIVWSTATYDFYKIDLSNGQVTTLANTYMGSYIYNAESWAAYGVAELGPNGYEITFRSIYNFGSGAYNSIGKYNITNGTFTEVASRTSGYGDMANFTYNKWNSKWYFSHEYSVSGLGIYSENLCSADASAIGWNSEVDYLWSNSDTNNYTWVSPNTSTNYSITVTNGSYSCSDTVAISVIQSPVVVDTNTNLLCFSDTNGSASLSVSGGTTPYTYAWSSGQTTAAISNLPGGVYTYSVTGGNACTVIDSIEVVEPSLITSNYVINSDATCFVSTDGNATITAMGGTGPYTYLWPSGGTDTTDAMVAGGVNLITITDANACQVVDTVLMSAPNEIPSPGAITTNTTLFCPGTAGTLTAANGQNGSANSTFSVTSGTLQTTNSSNLVYNLTNLNTNYISGGTLTLTLRGDLDQSYEFVYVYDENGTYVGSSSSLNTNCNTYGDATITFTSAQMTSWLADGQTTFTLSPTGNVYGCTYDFQGYVTLSYTAQTAKTFWFTSPSSDTLQAIASGTTASVTPLTTTTYYAANFLDGCHSGFDSLTVNIPPAPTTTYLVNPTTMCAGDTAQVTAYGAYSYTWPSGSDISGSSNTATVSPTTTTNYLVTISNSINCSYVDTMTITVNPLPVGNILTTSPVTCGSSNDGQAAVYGTGASSPYTYLWPNGSTNALQLALSSGDHVVTITDANGCFNTLTVNVPGPAALHFNATVNNISCNSANDGSITLNTTGGNSPYSYTWSNGSTSSSLSGLAPGSYSVTLTDNSSCTYDTTMVINEPNTLLASIISTTSETCSGVGNGSISAGGTGGTSPYTYLWNNGLTTSGLTNMVGGTYSVTITDANGCTATTSGTINTIPTTLAVSVTNVVNNQCFDGMAGAAQASVSGGASPYTYTWSNGATTANISGAASNAYTVTVTDNNLCQQTANVTITQPTQLVLGSTITSNVTCNSLADGVATATASGATPTYNYTWPNGGTGATNATLSAGIHVVTITDANGCFDTTSVTITEPQTITITETISNVSCFNAADGSISTSVTGGTAPYSYSWSTGANSVAINSLDTGSYSITVTDANGCMASNTFQVTQPDSLVASISGVTNAACFGAASGNATANVMGGSAPFTYAWSNGTSNANLTNAATGTYVVTITDANGCSDTSSVVISQPSSAIVLSTINQVNVLCNGTATGSAEIFANGGGSPYTYAWPNGTTTAMASGLAAGTYPVSVTDNYGCTQVQNVTITQSPALSLSITNLVNVDCFNANNGAISVSTSGGSSPYSFNWNTGQTTSNLNNVDTGNYTLVVTDGFGCMDSVSATITQPTELTATISNSQNVACSGASTGFAVVTAAGGITPYAYAWSTGSSTDSIYAQPAGFYNVTVTDANGCVDSTVANLVQPSSLVASASNIVNNACYGDALGEGTALVSGGSTPYTFAWPNGNTTASQTGLTAGDYIVTITDANTCQDTALISISQPDSILNSVVNLVDVLCYSDTTGAIFTTTSGGVGPYTYAWSSGEADTAITNKMAGAYTLTITDANACMNVNSFVINEPTDLVSTATITNALCNLDTNGLVLTTVSGGAAPYTYLWSTGDTTASLTNMGAGTYGVTITDQNGCADTLSNVLTEPAALEIAISASTDVTCGYDQTGTATTLTTGGTAPFNYDWTYGQQVENPTDLSAGVNVVTVTDANGCMDTNMVTIATSSNLTLQVVSQTNIGCNGDTTGAVAVAGNMGGLPYTYSWNVASTDSFLVNQPAGMYTAYVTDNFGCIDSLLLTIAEPAPIVGNIQNTGALACAGDSNGWIELNTTGGAGSISFLWPSGNTSSADSNLVAGTYTVTLTDTNMCATTFDAVLTEPNMLSNAFTYNQLFCYSDNNGAAASTITGGVAPYSYTWQDGQTTATAYNLTTGNYSVTITDANGCMLNDTAILTSGVAYVPSNLPTDTISCDVDITLSANNAFASYQWSTGGNAVSETFTQPGTYTFIGTTSQLCYTYDTVTINFFPSISVSLGADIANICEGTNTVLSGSGSFANYNWSTGETTPTVNVNTSGTYSLTVQDVNGCNASDSVDVNMWPLPIVNLGADTVICEDTWTGSFDLDAGAGFNNYTWSTGGSSQIETITTLGTYHVAVEDANGCIGSDTIVVSFDPCSSLPGISNSLNVSLFPNPTNNVLHVELTGLENNEVEIEIMSTNGQLVKAIEIIDNSQSKYQTQIDVSQFPQGLYFVLIKSGDVVKIEKITIY